jgi:hypothetical protein
MVNILVSGPRGRSYSRADLERVRRRARWVAALTAAIAVTIVGAAWLYVSAFISLGNIGSGNEDPWELFLVFAILGVLAVIATTTAAYRWGLRRGSPSKAISDMWVKRVTK